VVFIQKRAMEGRTRTSGNNPAFFCEDLDFVDLNVFKEGKSQFFLFLICIDLTARSEWLSLFNDIDAKTQEFKRPTF